MSLHPSNNIGSVQSGRMLVNLDIDLLRTFVLIVDTGSFTRTAERLCRTQSTISLQIKRLEDVVGKPLLTRNSRMVQPTADGDVLLSYARDILRINDQALTRLREPEVHGVVRLGTPEDFATVHLPQVLASFRQAYPLVTLEVTCDLTLNLVERFHAGEFDLVLVKREPQGTFGGVRVWREPLVWTAADRALLIEGEALPLVVAPHPCVYRKRAIRSLEGAGRRWRIAYTSPSLAGTQAAVLAGLGLAVLPKEMVPPGLGVFGEQDGLPPLQDTEIALMTPPTETPKPVQRLAKHIIHSLERVPPSRPRLEALQPA